MSELNKSYRIRTQIGNETEFVNIDENLIQDYDTFEILSVKVNSKDAYRLHNSKHGIVVGRVLANNGFGIPNAKISIFIKTDGNESGDIAILYPFETTVSEDRNGVKYNLLPNEKVDGCHQVVGTFPSKRYALDNDVILEVFDKYYKFTTKTNNSGDYLICGVPVGAHTLHMDLDLSDCGLLSQRPRDFVYKGYTIEQFETPTKFKGGTDYENLSQIFRQDQVVNVKPFWGNESLGESIGITRADINVNFKFEPTCVFMGSIFSDNASNGFSRKCIATDHMGDMDELVTGEGKIEMIRKTPGGKIEEFSIKGNKLIDANGVWCYQIPMNLDYMVTDEYGNMVPTDNPEKGIPTRASVRFRISMEDHEENTENFFRGKVLVPHNPQNTFPYGHENYDYEFGTYTRDESFRDLFLNNVYSVKSYIPRIQKNKNPKNEKFSGIKHCNNYGPNNPMPYNNIRIKMPLMFTILCALIKCFIFLVKITNSVISLIGLVLAWICTHVRLPFFITGDPWWNVLKWSFGMRCVLAKTYNERVRKLHLIVLKDGLCPDLENWYFAPCYIQDNTILSYSGTCDCTDWIGDFCKTHPEEDLGGYNILSQTLDYILNEGEDDDPQSIDDQNDDEDDNGTCLTVHTDYLISCIEMNLAQEYKVINFDFYNDWINGTIYIPRWVRYIKPKTRFLWINWSKEKVRGCMDDTKIFSKSRKYIQQCAIDYDREYLSEYTIINSVSKPNLNSDYRIRKANNLHKKRGIKHQKIFGNNGGICHQSTTMKGQYVYYLKPCEWLENSGIKANLFATDIILLGSFNECDLNGIPQTFTHLTSSTYVMPTNLALTNMDTNGALYAKGDGTICIGDSPSSADTGSVLTAEVRQIDGSGLTLYAEARFYSGATNYDLNESGDYPNGIELDTIALTEAAGIAWNYTGPGQGSIDESKMYYPGGHFLGISCVNAQTNLKSCINLSRICEIGSTMSQRRDSVRAIDENGNLKFTYTAPSGFISGDEIIDTDFRSMFATLNKKRLIATKRNPETGYKFYDFEFSMPINFNGAFSKMTNGSPYNTSIIALEEDLTMFGITLGPDREDYDPEEANNTQIKTRESNSLDYYMYRFGLTYEQLSNVSFQQKKFLRQPNPNDNPYVFYLPQYENSYYFYFGLKFGATALDEFNKQFYSECENLIIKKSPNMILFSEVDFCKNTGKIHVFTEGLEIPYQSIIIYNDLYSNPIYIIDGSSEEHRTCLTSETFVLINEVDGSVMEDFDFGNYTITLVDADGIEITKSVSVGVDLVSYSSQICNFNLPIDETGTTLQGSVWRGGYIAISELHIEGMELTDFDYIRLHIYEREDMTTPVYSGDYTGEELILYGFKKGVEYVLVLEYKCHDEDAHTINLEIFTLYDNSDVRLKLGNKNYSIDCIYENDSIMETMYQSWWWDDSHRDIGGDDVNDWEAWFYKAMFFNRNKLKYTFDSNVFAENCKKVLWGTPQKYDDISSTTGCSELPLEIQAGYTLDDKKSYYSTYGVDNCNFIPIDWEDDEEELLRSGNPSDFYPNCVMHYCAQAYRGVNVCGPYRGTMERDENNNIELSFSQEYFHNGYGCVFKPLPGGNLKFMIYDSTNLYENMVAEISELDCNYGVFYPTFIYPVIKRPFYIASEYIDYTDRELIYSENSAYTRNFVIGYDVVAKVNNGVTYDREFSPLSYITGLDNEFPRRLTEFDWYGLTEGSSNNRVEVISGHTMEELFSGETISYNVTEFFPDPMYAQFTTYHEEVFNPGFCSELGYTTKLDENQVTCIDEIVKVGEDENSAITYYLGIIENKEGSGLDFIKNGPNYIYLAHDTIPNVYFAICRLIKGPGYAIRVSEGSDFSETIVKIIIQMTGSNDGNIHIIFDYEDVYGTERTYDENLRIQHNSNYSNFGDIRTILALLNYQNYDTGSTGTGGSDNGYNLPLEAVKNGLILDTPTYNGNVITWKEAVMKLGPYMKQSSYYENRFIPVCPTTGNCKMFGLGIATYSNEGNETKVYKIYKDVVKYQEQYIPWGDGNESVWLSSEELIVDAAHNEITFQLSASSPTVISLDLAGINMGGLNDWYTINCEGSYIMDNKMVFDCLYPDVYTIKVTAIHNNIQQTRENWFKFQTTQNPSAAEVIFKQTGAIGPIKQVKVTLIDEDLNNGNFRIRLQALPVNSSSWGDDDYVQIDFKVNGGYQEDWNFEYEYYNDMFSHDNIVVPGWPGISYEYHDVLSHLSPTLDTQYNEVIDSNLPNIISIIF